MAEEYLLVVPNQLWYCSINTIKSEILSAIHTLPPLPPPSLPLFLYCFCSVITLYRAMPCAVLYSVHTLSVCLCSMWYFFVSSFILLCVLFSLHFVFLYFLNSGRKCLPFLIHYTYENEANIRMNIHKHTLFFTIVLMVFVVHSFVLCTRLHTNISFYYCASKFIHKNFEGKQRSKKNNDSSNGSSYNVTTTTETRHTHETKKKSTNA